MVRSKRKLNFGRGSNKLITQFELYKCLQKETFMSSLPNQLISARHGCALYKRNTDLTVKHDNR